MSNFDDGCVNRSPVIKERRAKIIAQVENATTWAEMRRAARAAIAYDRDLGNWVQGMEFVFNNRREV